LTPPGGRDGNAQWPWAAVPASMSDLMRPHLDGVVTTVVSAVREEIPEYDRPLEGEFGRLISQGVGVALHQFVDLLGRDTPLPDLSIYEAMGREEHRQGRTLDALQSAYRVGARVSWRACAAYGEQAQVPPDVMYRLAEAIFAFIDRLAAASVAGYAAGQSLREGTLQARRQALLELLVAAVPPTPADLQEAARAASWTVPARVAVLALAEGDPVSLARRMPEGTLAAAHAPVGLLLVPEPERPGQPGAVEEALRGRRAVLGPSVPVLEAARSAARARAGWALHAAGRLGDAPVARTDDHLLDLLVAGDAGLAAELTQRRLAALDALPAGARTRAYETLRAWLDAHGDVATAGEALHVHAQTVRYRLARVREAIGDTALDDPQARLELQLALRVAGPRTA